MMEDNIPKHGEKKFSCPQCNVVSSQSWKAVTIDLDMVGTDEPKAFDYVTKNFGINNWRYSYATCYNCGDISIWFNCKMIYPLPRSGPDPNLDMPDETKDLFNEARDISIISPRASIALLRLCLEQLVNHLDPRKEPLNVKIKELVKRDIPEEVQQALDIVRVSGNDAIHDDTSSTIYLDDTKEHLEMLFRTINIIVDKIISSDKQIKEAYGHLSQKDHKAIQNRDQDSQ